jgi:protein O-GlcNAc transferase
MPITTRMSSEPAADAAFADLLREGVAHHGEGRLAEAERLYREVLRRDPGHGEALHLLGLMAGQAGRPDMALDLLRRAAQRVPNNANLYNNIGEMLRQLGRMREAIDAYRRAITLDPNHSAAYANGADALRAEADRAQALGQGKAARELRLLAAKYLSELGLTHWRRLLLEKAEEAYRAALALDAKNTAALVNLGAVLTKTGRLGEGEAVLRRALALEPNSAEGHANLGYLLLDRGAREQGVAALRKARSLRGELPSVGDTFAHSELYYLSYRSEVAPADLFAAHRQWGLNYVAGLRKAGRDQVTAFENSRDPDRRLRVGYLSSDMRKHSVSYFFETLLEAHSAAAVETYCYADVAVPDYVTQRLQGLAHQWRPVAGMDDVAVRRQIRADAIDVLVELGGHTSGTRLTVLAVKPAPVTATWLGYPATTGLPTVDYRLTDEVADPPGEADRLHTETLVRLPHGFLCYRPEDEAPAVAPLPAVALGRVTFGSFNNPAKITAETVGAWSRVLEGVPGSRMLLKGTQFADPGTCGHFRRLFAAAGIGPERLEFRGRATTPAAHLAMYGEVDIGLDPFPYNGTTTTCEAFWMGVPTVSLRGDRHAARVGASLLTQLGLQELIGESLDGYVAAAIALAGDRERLAGLRDGLRTRMLGSPLGDRAGFARRFEAALREMWRRWCATAPAG